jgi:hypothetical protein
MIFELTTLLFLRVGGIYRELLPRAEYFSQALYTFDIGQNDITSSYFVNNTTEQVESIIPDLMERLTSIIQVHYCSLLNTHHKTELHHVAP